MVFIFALGLVKNDSVLARFEYGIALLVNLFYFINWKKASEWETDTQTSRKINGQDLPNTRSNIIGSINPPSKPNWSTSPPMTCSLIVLPSTLDADTPNIKCSNRDYPSQVTTLKK